MGGFSADWKCSQASPGASLGSTFPQTGHGSDGFIGALNWLSFNNGQALQHKRCPETRLKANFSLRVRARQPSQAIAAYGLEPLR